MTVDMLAAAFIWPEEILLGRTRPGDDLEADAPDDTAPEQDSAPEPGAMPFWTALMRRFRADPALPGTEIR